MTVYALTSSSEPLQIRYVGVTVKPLDTRLKGHFNDLRHNAQRKNARKCQWFRDTITSGASVQIHALSQHNNPAELLAAESSWIAFWQLYCDLLNTDGVTRPHKRCLGKLPTSTL